FGGRDDRAGPHDRHGAAELGRAGHRHRRCGDGRAAKPLKIQYGVTPVAPTSPSSARTPPWVRSAVARSASTTVRPRAAFPRPPLAVAAAWRAWAATAAVST